MTPAAQSRALAPDPLDQAISWAVRMASGAATAQDRAACDAWRAADPAHEAAWQQVRAVEQPFQEMAASPAGPVAYGTLQAARAMQARSHGRRRALKLLGLGAMASMVGLLSLRLSAWQERAQYHTAVGERRRVVLPDGTELWLNTDTRARVVFTPAQRLLVLDQGEIFITTGDDAGSFSGRRPLWVDTPAARLHAIGTRFGVRLEQDGAALATRLHVDQGQVAVHSGDLLPVLAQAGDSIRVRAPGAAPERLADAAFDASSWTQGVLVVKQMPLGRFVAELARYRAAGLACAPDAADLRVSGVFQLDGADPAARALKVLASTLPVRVVAGPADALTVTAR
ncbi:FecR domain-containing protein [Achromobacter sp. DH1f]|uniref:FecR domain-containing protein n=1 Tax=Achromobacter sp. DH1f TaxID=1397275 RepID=UPI00046A1F38|nr:FecR domain-containing protein [Achromobacter sp. DH1f]